MKYKSYGDNNKEFSSGNDLELLTISDKLSARSLNRPSENLYENQEEIYKLINTLLKTTYGNIERAIIPDLYEEFAPDGFFINSFAGSSNYYLRIPTGSMLLTTNSIKDDNVLIYGEFDYKDTNSDYKYSRLGKDYVFTNKPNINLLERQLASLINLDLDDTYNDIKIETVELPVTYMVYKAYKDPSGDIPFPKGSIDVLSKDGKTLYICTKENAEYYCDATKIQEDLRGLKRPDYESINFKKYYYTDDTIVVNEAPASDEGTYTYFTTKIEKATFAEDENGRAKKCIGYCLKVTRNLPIGKENVYFPNERKRAYKDIYLGSSEINSNYYELTIERESPISYKVRKEEGMGLEDIYYLFISKINSSNDEVFAELISDTSGEKPIKGIRISFGTRYLEKFDNYAISLKKGDTSSSITEFCKDKDGTPINNLPVEKSARQEYYRNIFDLTNDFINKFEPYLLPTTDKLLNYLSGEILLPLKIDESNLNPENYYIYYDITADKNKVIDDPRYDKSGRIFISTKSTEDTENEKDEIIIKLFEIGVSWSEEGKIPKVKNINYLIPRLDKRLISTKRGEFQTLSAKNGKNSFTVGKDGTVVTGGLTVDTIKSSGEGGDSTLNIDTLVANQKVQTNSIKPLNPTDYTTVDKLKIVDGIEGNGNVINVITFNGEDPNNKLPDNNKNGEWKIIKREVELKELK